MNRKHIIKRCKELYLLFDPQTKEYTLFVKNYFLPFHRYNAHSLRKTLLALIEFERYCEMKPYLIPTTLSQEGQISARCPICGHLNTVVWQKESGKDSLLNGWRVVKSSTCPHHRFFLPLPQTHYMLFVEKPVSYHEWVKQHRKNKRWIHIWIQALHLWIKTILQSHRGGSNDK